MTPMSANSKLLLRFALFFGILVRKGLSQRGGFVCIDGDCVARSAANVPNGRHAHLSIHSCVAWCQNFNSGRRAVTRPPSRCGTNAEFKRCKGCDPTCADANPPCNAACVPGCGCKSGFVRSGNNGCIRKSACGGMRSTASPISTAEPETVETEEPETDEPETDEPVTEEATEETDEPDEETTEAETEEPSKDSVWECADGDCAECGPATDFDCEDGAVTYPTKEDCEKLSDCGSDNGKKPASGDCSDNEEAGCDKCEPTCDQPFDSPTCPSGCKQGCKCVEDYARNTDTGKCVTLESCFDLRRLRDNVPSSKRLRKKDQRKSKRNKKKAQQRRNKKRKLKKTEGVIFVG